MREATFVPRVCGEVTACSGNIVWFWRHVVRRRLGDFPQAFSHVGMLNTAHNLARVIKRPSSVRPASGASTCSGAIRAIDRRLALAESKTPSYWCSSDPSAEAQ